MRVLFLASTFPHPPTDGWRLRTLELLRALAAEHRVTLVSFADAPPPGASMDALRGVCEAIHLVPRRSSYSPLALLGGLVTRAPFSILNYRSRAMRRVLSALWRAHAYDVVHVEDIHLAQYALPMDGAIRVLDMHNVESQLLRRYAELQRDPARRRYARLTAAKLDCYEAAHVGAFDRVLTCSDADGALVSRRCGHRGVVVIPNGVDTARFRPASQVEDPATLLFVGRMDYVANVDAVHHLCREILPRVWAALPETRVHVVGKNPPPAVRRLADDPRVVVTGFVEEVAPYYARATVFVTPLRFGSGTRLKVLEAMASGKATVSTTLGCEGLDLPSDAVWLADTPATFCDAVVQLCRAPERRRAMGRRARQVVVERYAWPIVHERLREVYRRLPGTAGSGTRPVPSRPTAGREPECRLVPPPARRPA